MDNARIGVDIVEVSRMERVLKKTPLFASRMFTEEECLYCDSKARPAAHYAARFAAREAVLKALGTGFAEGIGRKDVSVSRDNRGKPYAKLAGRAAQIAEDLGIVEIALSITHTGDLAVANAMAITQGARPLPKDSGSDERAELARSFKEARAVLEELERVQELELSSVVASDVEAVDGGTDEARS